MDNINSFLNDELSSQDVRVKLEHLPDSVLDSLLSQPSSSISAVASYNVSSGDISPDRSSSGNTSSVASQKKMPSASIDFQFKTPSPISRPVRSTNLLRHASSSKPQSNKFELSSEKQKQSSSLKKKPAVKIASFAKASSVDRLAPSAGSADFKISKQARDSCSPSISSQSNAGGSKQPVTQTSLPTPALNAALRSFFNFNENNIIDTSQSDDDEDDDDDDEDVEEEEILVYMQFDSKLDSDLLQPHTPFKIIGVDTEKPVLQLGNQVFEGNWNDTVGTAVFFEENPSASPGDPVFMKNPPSTLNYHSKTQKALIMSRIFVKPKEENDDDGRPMVPMAIVEVSQCQTD